MTQNDQIHILINPIAGGKSKKKVIAEIEKLILNGFNIQYTFTQYPSHAAELTRNLLNNKEVSIIGVAGGDGTVNEVAKELIEKPVSLWVIPQGSGNGLAKSLNIPVRISKHFKNLNHLKLKKIDAGKMNDHYFFVTAGIGLDGKVANQFKHSKKRGFLTYVFLTTKLFFQSRPIDFSIDKNDTLIYKRGMQFSVCNAGQFGNNFYISPNSKLDDGLLEYVIIPKTNFFKTLYLILHIFRKKADSNKSITIQSFQKIEVKCDYNYAHLDGEPIELKDKKNTFTVCKGVLKIWY